MTTYFGQFWKLLQFYDLKIIFGDTGVNKRQNINKKHKYFENEKRIFGQTIWLLHRFLRNQNTKRLISPEREGLRDSNFHRFIFGMYMFIGNIYISNIYNLAKICGYVALNIKNLNIHSKKPKYFQTQLKTTNYVY